MGRGETEEEILYNFKGSSAITVTSDIHQHPVLKIHNQLKARSVSETLCIFSLARWTTSKISVTNTRLSIKNQSYYRPGQALRVQGSWAPRFQDNRHMQMVRLPTLRTGRLYPPGNIPGTLFCYSLSHLQGHSAAGRIMSMKNSNDTIGNRTRDLPACSAVPQPTASPRAPKISILLCKR